MPSNDFHQELLAHRLVRILIAFFLLASLFLLAVYFAAPSIYTATLNLASSPTDRYPLPATLFLLGIMTFIIVLIIGVIRQWRWMFWLLLIAFAFMILEIPATILQLTGVFPSLYPVWYSLCRMGTSIIAFAIGAWMLSVYRRYGAWARGTNRYQTGHKDKEK